MNFPVEQYQPEIFVQGSIFTPQDPLNKFDGKRGYILLNPHPYQRLQCKLDLQVFVVTWDNNNYRFAPRIIFTNPFGGNPGEKLSVLVSEPRNKFEGHLENYKGTLDNKNLSSVLEFIKRSFRNNGRAEYGIRGAPGSVIDLKLDQKTSRFVIVGNRHLMNNFAAVVAIDFETVDIEKGEIKNVKPIALRQKDLSRGAVYVNHLLPSETRFLQDVALTNYGV